MYDPFFRYARERHHIYLARQAGLPRSEWTDDAILQAYRFCNIYRELDTTTIWFRENVREVRDYSPLVATVLFRWFNRIQTGEAMFTQRTLSNDGSTAFERYLETKDTDILKSAILAYCGKGPYVTGSYIIKTPDGMNKLDGVLWCVDKFVRESSEYDPHHYPKTLEKMWEWLCHYSYLGDFMAYEIVTDLRHTYLLEDASDITTWANPGPGAMRGLNRIHGRDLNKKLKKSHYIQEMRNLLDSSRNPVNWPKEWPVWEMREVEHTLCEFDKYLRASLGEGRPRQVFKSNS